MKKPFYITTPIYYVTDVPHLGHLYTTLAADVRSRYEHMWGKEVWFLTGTDEHGQKVAKKAKENGESPQSLVDRVHARYKTAWERFNIHPDDFIRTTEDRHKKVVGTFLKKLMDTGDVYLHEYEGWYCVSDEAYLTDTQVKDGKSIESGKPVERLREESYFFRMSKYVAQLKQHIQDNPDFIVPESRKNEVLGFLNQEVRDISVSRTTIDWGIPMPADSKAKSHHTVYVWFDALTNYISALDPDAPTGKFPRLWPEAIHVIGKDILRFHAVYWPTFLMALGLPLPKQIVAHGWLTLANQKMSKSSGNAVDPMTLAGTIGVDAMRYFLMRDFVFGQDGEYTVESMYQRINSDLANDFGNCLSRVCNMSSKYLGTAPLTPGSALDTFPLKSMVIACVDDYHQAMKQFQFNRALEAAWKIVGELNRHLENTSPWKLAKDPARLPEVSQILLGARECLRITAVLATPFIPESAGRALASMGEDALPQDADVWSSLAWGSGKRSFQLHAISPLFPRLELPGAAG